MSKINRRSFFDNTRLTLFNGSIGNLQVNGLTALLDYWETNHSAKDDRWLAYVLGTAHHEVDRKMQPIKEYGTDTYFFKMYDIKGNRPDVAKRLGNFSEGDGALFHGRGFVQITGRYNYAYWQDRLGVDLTSSPTAADRVLQIEISTPIIFEGMMNGSFTGKKLSDYFFEVRQDWEGARRIVNGADKKALIASYARSYYSSISYTV
jgi:putative chitinase